MNSRFITLWSENEHYMFSFLLNLLGFVWLPRIRSVLETVPWALEKTVYPVTEWPVLMRHLDHITDGAIQVFSVLTDCLPVFSIT